MGKNGHRHSVWPNEQHVIIKQTYKTQVAAFEAPEAEGQ